MPEKSILAIVVTHHPDGPFVERIERLAEQADAVLIVDNDSGPSSVAALRELALRLNVNLILNSENLGVAAALNIGARKALAQDYEWVATFDQDSLISGNYFDDLLMVYRKCEQRHNIAMLSPVYRDPELGPTCSPKEFASLPFVEVDKTMTSGSLIKTECFRAVGLFDETLFIDLVDHEFALRLIRAGYRIFRSNTCVLLHRLGKTVSYSFFGLRFFSSGHDSTRRYYMARNRMFVYKKYVTFRPRWIIKDCFSFLKEMIKIVLVEENSGAKIAATIAGIRDGMFGRTGKLSPR